MYLDTKHTLTICMQTFINLPFQFIKMRNFVLPLFGRKPRRGKIDIQVSSITFWQIVQWLSGTQPTSATHLLTMPLIVISFLDKYEASCKLFTCEENYILRCLVLQLFADELYSQLFADVWRALKQHFVEKSFVCANSTVQWPIIVQFRDQRELLLSNSMQY